MKITGSNFRAGASVIIGTTYATSVLILNSQTITCLTPSGSAGTVAVTVVNADATSGTMSDGFTYESASAVTVPDTLFSLQVNKRSSWPVPVPYRGSRLWDSAGGAQWPQIQTCTTTAFACQIDPVKNTTWVWTNLDNYLAELYSAGTFDNVMMTLSRTPGWAVNLAADPTGLSGTECNYYNNGTGPNGAAAGQCLPPVDLNADGSGTDAIWKAWIQQLALHVNDPGYLQTHAHIKYWEPWNEAWRSTVMANWSGKMSAQFTFAQLLRMVEDARCIILGQGTIHNDPGPGLSTTCTATPIDASAKIVMPDGDLTAPNRQWADNFLYCNQSPPAGSHCTWANGFDWGSAAVDVINTHGNGSHSSPERRYTSDWPKFYNSLSTVDQVKPRMCGECSYGDPSITWTDVYDQTAFVPRWLALEYSFGITFNHWYAYDVSTDGAMLNVNSNTVLQPLTTVWTLVFEVLRGASPAQAPFCQSSGTVWTCKFTRAGGYSGALVWDAQYGPLGTTAPAHCGTATEPIICGSTPYFVDTSTYNSDYRTMDNVSHPVASTISVGAVPILLEGQAAN